MIIQSDIFIFVCLTNQPSHTWRILFFLCGDSLSFIKGVVLLTWMTKTGSIHKHVCVHWCSNSFSAECSPYASSITNKGEKQSHSHDNFSFKFLSLPVFVWGSQLKNDPVISDRHTIRGKDLMHLKANSSNLQMKRDILWVYKVKKKCFAISSFSS